MAFFKVQRPTTTSGKTQVNGKTLYVVEADDAATALATVSGQFEEDGSWADVTAVDITDFSAADFTGFRYVFKVGGAAGGDADLAEAEYIGVSTPDLDDVGAGIVAALNAAYTSAIAGAVADDGGSFTDETTEANNATIDDMTLLPAAIAENDAYYFGGVAPFNRLNQTISQVGTGTYTLTWQYWDGDSWEDLTSLTDGTTNWKTTGANSVDFARPSDWAASSIGGVGPLYWIRAVADDGTMTQQPLGSIATTQVAIASYSTPTVTLSPAADLHGDRQVSAVAYAPGGEEPIPQLIGTVVDGGVAAAVLTVVLEAQTAIPAIVAED